MAKTGKNLQQIKGQQFDELMIKDRYYNTIYLYLLKFEDEFIGLSLKSFILNCKNATDTLILLLASHRHRKDFNIEDLHEQKEIYDKEKLLTNFELYLTRFIVAHNIYNAYPHLREGTIFFNQTLNICERHKFEFKYLIKYSKNITLGDEINKNWELVLNENEKKQPTPPQKEIEPIDRTLHQQFLIFHYLFKHLEISTNSIDKTQIARFIQFATQKQLKAKKIQNTSIYKLVDNPFNGYKKDNGTTQTNLQKVRELFESIGLKEIAEIVGKDIV